MFCCRGDFIGIVWILAVGAAVMAPLVVDAVPANDDCENALALQPSESAVVTGSTLDASIDGLNICGENVVSSPGVWYRFQPLADTVAHVSTCTNETNFDTALTIYEGECSSLKCVDGRDDDLECDAGKEEHSTVSWQAAAGQTYYVLVHGSEANHTGDFGLLVTESQPLTSSSSLKVWKSTWLLPFVALGLASMLLIS